MLDYIQLLDDLRAQDFDSIRFASYRLACKLRYLQRRFFFNQIDIWHIIEAVRDNSLNRAAVDALIGREALADLLSTVYVQLNKRVPVSDRVNSDVVSTSLSLWLRATFPSDDGSNAIAVLNVKVFLALLSRGKTVDIYRYIFSLIADSSGWLLHSRLRLVLRAILSIPESLLESPSFFFSESLPTDLFPLDQKYTINNFLQIMLTEPGPQCLLWFPLIAKMTAVEDVLHPIMCDGCRVTNFRGFRYKCQRCYNYHLCQDCFWRGKTSNQHSVQHQCKEYTFYKPPTKQFGHSLRKSFRCVPEKRETVPRVADRPTATLNLTHIVPAIEGSLNRNGVPFHAGSHGSPFNRRMYDSFESVAEPSFLSDESPGEEHSLIARYSRRLADVPMPLEGGPASGNLFPRFADTPGFDSGFSREDSMEEKQVLVAKLENRNREMMKEILRLRREMDQDGQAEAAQAGVETPQSFSELEVLQQRRGHLNEQLGRLQDSRRDLIDHLDELMQMLRP